MSHRCPAPDMKADRDALKARCEQAIDALRRIREWCDDLSTTDGDLAASVETLIYSDEITALVKLGEQP